LAEMSSSMSDQIPPYREDDVLALLKMEPEQLLQLASAFANAPLEASVKKFIDGVEHSAQNSPHVRDLAPLFLSLKLAQLTAKESVETFVKDLIEEFRLLLKTDLEQDTAYWEQLSELMQKILSSKGMSWIAKSLQLQQENARMYATARILTDIRPVFGENHHLPPPMGVVLHTLKLSYFTNDGKENDFHVVLDRLDLKQLRDVIDRALVKEATLANMKTSFPILQIEGEGTR